MSMMTKLFFILVALSFLNRSIDLDHLKQTCHFNIKYDFDDVDNITEYLIEEIIENSNLISEEDKDSGDDNNSSASQQIIQPEYCEQLQNNHAVQIYNYTHISFYVLRHTSNGFYFIVSPPPDSRDFTV
jgi:hypothetical protein